MFGIKKGKESLGKTQRDFEETLKRHQAAKDRLANLDKIIEGEQIRERERLENAQAKIKVLEEEDRLKEERHQKEMKDKERQLARLRRRLSDKEEY